MFVDGWGVNAGVKKLESVGESSKLGEILQEQVSRVSSRKLSFFILCQQRTLNIKCIWTVNTSRRYKAKDWNKNYEWKIKEHFSLLHI